MPQAQERPRRGEEPVSSKPGSRGGVEENHPAFGVAVVTRAQGTPRSLFQSDVLHSETITLSIQTARRGRDLNHDWVHPEKELVEVEMSLAQWGALVSSIGIGSGVPVTIRRTADTVFVPSLPYQPRFKASLDEVNGTVGKLFARARETLAALEDAIDNKKGMRAVRDALRLHSSTIEHTESNSEFAVKSMVAAGEKVTSQVRADIESQILAAARLTDSQGAITAPEMRLGEIEAPGDAANENGGSDDER
jgi:hypothetical protein